MLNGELKDISIYKKLDILKKYVLFCCLSTKKNMLKHLKDTKWKIGSVIVYLPIKLLSLNYKREYKLECQKEKRNL